MSEYNNQNGESRSRFDAPDEAPVQPRQPQSRPASGPRPQPRSASGPRPASGGRAPQSGARRPAPAPSAPGRGALPKGFAPLAGVCAVIIVLGLVLQGLLPDGFALTAKKAREEVPVAAQVSEIHGEGPIRLNEVMTANGGVLVDAAGETPDWIEVANIGNRPANLNGYVLAKNAKAGNVFLFPDMILQPGECAVVYADSTLRAEAGEELHAPFRLSSGGDVLMLFNTAEVAVDTVNLPALAENTAYVRQDRDTWVASDQTTPGMLNTEENYRALTTVTQTANVQLAEVVASNTQYAPDENGVAQDYVALRNTSADPVDIGGWYLSDDPKLPRMWKLPAGVTIPGGGTLVVHCSGLNRAEDPAHLHTSFRLSSEGETVTLSNASGQPVDAVTYDLLRTDTACVRGADGSWSVGTPTK